MSYKTINIKDLLTDGYLVAIEGDSELYDDDLGDWLSENIDKYIMLNHIYKQPEKLLELKNIKIDAFLFQTPV